jgi:hypothetical protein
MHRPMDVSAGLIVFLAGVMVGLLLGVRIRGRIVLRASLNDSQFALGNILIGFGNNINIHR